MCAEHSLSPGPLHECLRVGGQFSSGLTLLTGLLCCRTASGVRHTQGRQSGGHRVHPEVHAEEAAVRHVLQSS